MIPEALSIGRAVVSLRLLLPIASVAVGLAAVWFLLGRDRAELRKLVLDRLTTAGFLFFLVWKATPIVTRFETIRREPLLILYAPGGTVGLILGVLAVVGYVGYTVVRTRAAAESPSVPAVDVVRAVVLTGVSSLVAYAILFAVIAVVSASGAGQASARVGDPAPSIELETLDGGTFSLGDASGRPVVVNFWATWCGPCRAETAVKSALAEQFAGEAIVVGVNLTNSETGPGDVARFAEEWDVRYPILLDRTGRVGAAYGVRGTPTTVVIGADGTVHARIFGAMSLDAGARAVRAALR